MATVKYELDANSFGPVDTQSSWTNEANAFDTNHLNTFAQSSATGLGNSIEAHGSNCPVSQFLIGIAVQSVRFRAFLTNGAGTMNFNWFSVFSEDLGTNTISGVSNAWSSWQTITVPSGGWTWNDVQGIGLVLWPTVAGVQDVYSIQIEVTYNSSPPSGYPRYVRVGSGMGRSESAK